MKVKPNLEMWSSGPNNSAYYPETDANFAIDETTGNNDTGLNETALVNITNYQDETDGTGYTLIISISAIVLLITVMIAYGIIRRIRQRNMRLVLVRRQMHPLRIRYYRHSEQADNPRPGNSRTTAPKAPREPEGATGAAAGPEIRIEEASEDHQQQQIVIDELYTKIKNSDARYLKNQLTIPETPRLDKGKGKGRAARRRARKMKTLNVTRENAATETEDGPSTSSSVQSPAICRADRDLGQYRRSPEYAKCIVYKRPN